MVTCCWGESGPIRNRILIRFTTKPTTPWNSSLRTAGRSTAGSHSSTVCAFHTTGLDAPAGVQTHDVGSTTLAEIDNVNPGVSAIGTNALNRNDHHTPRTRSYSFSVSQRLPGASLLELSYVGNSSDYLLNDSDV